MEQFDLIVGPDVGIGGLTFGHSGTMLEELIHLELGLFVQVLGLKIRSAKG